MRTRLILFCLVLAALPQVSYTQTPPTTPHTAAAASSSLPKGYVSRDSKLYFSIPLGTSTAASSHALLDVTVPNNQCATIPQATAATMTDDNLFSMSSDVAASLKIQIPIGSGGVSGSSNQSVFMRQFKRYATCTAPNGDVLEYGHALRATVLSDATSIQGNAEFRIRGGSSDH